MREKLENLLNNAYSPYYKFPVAAILVTNDLQEFCGVNVENANGTSICAERNAISSAIACGYKKGDFKELYLMLGNDSIGFPCFACRQVMLEFMEKDSKVICLTKSGLRKELTLEQLCPYPFDSEDLI